MNPRKIYLALILAGPALVSANGWGNPAETPTPAGNENSETARSSQPGSTAIVSSASTDPDNSNNVEVSVTGAVTPGLSLRAQRPHRPLDPRQRKVLEEMESIFAVAKTHFGVSLTEYEGLNKYEGKDPDFTCPSIRKARFLRDQITRLGGLSRYERLDESTKALIDEREEACTGALEEHEFIIRHVCPRRAVEKLLTLNHRKQKKFVKWAKKEYEIVKGPYNWDSRITIQQTVDIRAYLKAFLELWKPLGARLGNSKEKQFVPPRRDTVRGKE